MIFKKLMGQFVDVIQWLDDSPDTMVWRFERQGNEIKHGAKLTVREGQTAVFVNEGEIADVFTPGMYELFTRNLPILSTLQAWPHGFESPFKAEVYFCVTRVFTDLKWGTKNPVIARDPEFGPVRLRAFGSYAIRIKDPAVFLREVVGTDGHFTVDEISDQLRNTIVARFGTIVAGSGIPVLDLAANYDQLGQFVLGRIAPEFANYGLELTTILVENVSLPPEVEAALDRRTSMGVVGDLGKYAQFQAAEAMREAAANPGAAGQAIGMMVGMGLGQQAASPWGPRPAEPAATPPPAAPAAAAPAPAAAPPPLPGAPVWHVAAGGQATGPFALDQLKGQVAGGTLTRATLVWKEGMAAWQAAGEVPELQGLLAAVPPPLPGTA
ncbi:MAG: SPFH domain-containing protein [Geminicoccaceae bacterium]